MVTHRLSNQKLKSRNDRLPTAVLALTVADAVEHFLLHQRSARHSPRTIENYQYSLSRFKSWLADQGIDRIDQITSNVLRTYFAKQQERLSAGTVATDHRRIKAFFMFHDAEGNASADVIRRVKAPKLDREILPAFTEEEIHKLIDATKGSDPLDVRNRCLVMLMLDSGMRLQEVADLKVGSICQRSGVIHVKLGKGGKDRLTRIGAEALRSYQRYLRVRGGVEGDPLWLGERGVLTSDGISITVQRIGQSCGVHSHAHKFRRTTALMMLRSGCSIYTLQKMLGHADSSLTILRRYLAQTENTCATNHIVATQSKSQLSAVFEIFFWIRQGRSAGQTGSLHFHPPAGRS